MISGNSNTRKIVHHPINATSNLLRHLLLSVRRQVHKLKQQIAIQDALDRVRVESILGLQQPKRAWVQSCGMLNSINDLGAQERKAFASLFRDGCDHAEAAVEGSADGQMADSFVGAREYNLGD